ncbi:MAG: hypothetical protein C0598_09810, partial [Marinilabiliales bacterium]
MKRKNNKSKYLKLQKEFDFFEYQSYKINVENSSINLEFNFNLSNKYFFNPKIRISLPEKPDQLKISSGDLNILAFNIGMVELVSYWKAACPKKIIIKPHTLNDQQIKWWRKLYYNGLGEFFYLNSIDVNENDFLEIKCFGNELESLDMELDFTKVIVPVGGGKDSIVSLEVLKSAGIDIYPMMLNPNP